jgi:hypothetical protein
MYSHIQRVYLSEIQFDFRVHMPPLPKKFISEF